VTLRLDCTGQLCPRPVLELARRIHDIDVGDTVVVLSDDPAAASDIPAWCRLRGHEFVRATGTEYEIRRVH
jgi:tRNA 2-thiouridine synthesizing protein A